MKREFTEEQKAANREAQRKRRAKNPERVREVGRQSERRRRLRRYGITDIEYQIIWTLQNQSCAICGQTTVPTNRQWHIDHCHSTGKVRGILCHHCNLLLGNAKDNTSILEKAICYLKENQN